MSSVIPVPKIEDDSYDWYARHQEKCLAVQNKRYDIILIGDSLTHFWEPGVISHGAEIWEKYFSGMNILNLGFGFDRTQNVLWRLQNGEFHNQTPGVVVLNIGTNNLGGTERCPADDATAAAAGVCKVVETLRRMSPDTHIIVMNIFPRGTGRENRFVELIKDTNAVITEKLSGQENVTLLNINDKLVDAEGGLRSEMTFDSCHLSNQGYDIWASALMPFSTPLS